MALRSEALLACCLAVWSTAAEPVEFRAVQDRLFRDQPAAVRVDESGIDARREGRSYKWTWDDIQKLTILADEIRIQTYEDVRWQGWKDREWTFEKVPAGMPLKLYALAGEKLASRVEMRVAVPSEDPEWSTPAKLRVRLGGPEGQLTIYRDRIAFASPERNASRTWSVEQVDSVSSGGPHELTIRTPGEDHDFTLKRPLKEQQYEQLWRRIEEQRRLR